MIKKTVLHTIIFFLGVIACSQAQTTRSVLAEGETYKLQISETGIQRLTYEEIRDNTQIPVDQINPNNLHLYGNRGGVLPLENSKQRADDLIENAIFISGGDDNSFDPGDYILFYAEGPDRINAEGDELSFEKNLYDLHNYYFLKVDNSPGIRIQSKSSVSAPAYVSYTSRLLRHEVDNNNLLGLFGSSQGSGKEWYGEIFTNTRVQDFSSSFLLDPADTQESGILEMHFTGRSEQSSSVSITFNDQTFEKTIARVSLDNLEGSYATKAVFSNRVSLVANPKVEVAFEGANDGKTEGWLDFIQLIANEKIKISNTPFTIHNRGDISQSVGGYQIPYSGNDLIIWDVTELDKVSSVEYIDQGNEIEFGYNTGNRINTFIAFESNSNFITPSFLGQVENQNIHGIERVDLVIVTHPNFRESADLLANHRRTTDNFIVEVIDVFDIYNEFAGGKADPTAIRDMAKMLHERDENFKYLILLGDATYDYRGLVPNLPNHNFVPTYETDLSTNHVDSHPTDDYFGLLSDDEGSDDLKGTLELGIGRIPAATAEDADAVIRKIIHYDTNQNRFGEWRTKIGFAADDVDAFWDVVHLEDADEIARSTQEEHPNLLQQKVYFDAFNQVATPGGSRYPDANKAINDNIFKGQLIFNYLGHGGPKGLSQERVLQIPDIQSWNNMDKLTVFITATCSFTGFDEPNLVSAGEHLILNPNGGAVAIFTTVRSVFASQNSALTDALYKELFDRKNGEAARLGDVIVSSKNNGNSRTRDNSRKFLLIGDPSMQLALPKHDIAITHYNDVEIDTALDSVKIDTIGALGKGTLRGKIVSLRDNSTITNFNGEVFLTVYDKPSNLQTLVNDGKGSPLSFDVNKNILYKGTATVTNGLFEADIILPKDINYSFGGGSIFFYATDNNTEDASGHFAGLVIGGDSDTVISDEEGPEIDIFFDDRSFEFGGETGCEPILLVDLADENGINLSSTSIGHDITATLEDQNGDKIVLNDFYEPTVNQTGQGTVTYQLGTLEEGPHKIYIKAWDILNNSSEEVMEFVVTKTEGGQISNAYNYPNPFTTRTEFLFDHDLTNSQVDIGINIYTISGKLVKSITDSRFASGSRINDIVWDGRDDFGNKLAKGIYLYKINLSSSELNLSRESEFLKLVVLN